MLFFLLFCNSQDLCQNYIRVLALPTPGTLIGCGTNAFRPMCRMYGINGNSYSIESEKPGQAVCPYDPAHNSTAVFVGKYNCCYFYVWSSIHPIRTFG